MTINPSLPDFRRTNWKSVNSRVRFHDCSNFLRSPDMIECISIPLLTLSSIEYSLTQCLKCLKPKNDWNSPLRKLSWKTFFYLKRQYFHSQDMFCLSRMISIFGHPSELDPQERVASESASKMPVSYFLTQQITLFQSLSLSLSFSVLLSSDDHPIVSPVGVTYRWNTFFLFIHCHG